MQKIYVVTMSLAFLSGCMAPVESNGWFLTTPPDEIKKFYEARCESYGFVKGSPQMADCIAKEIRSARQRNATITAEIISG